MYITCDKNSTIILFGQGSSVHKQKPIGYVSSTDVVAFSFYLDWGGV